MKKGAGKLVGDEKLQAEGMADKAKGMAESVIGGAKEAIRDVNDKI